MVFVLGPWDREIVGPRGDESARGGRTRDDGAGGVRYGGVGPDGRPGPRERHGPGTLIQGVGPFGARSVVDRRQRLKTKFYALINIFLLTILSLKDPRSPL